VWTYERLADETERLTRGLAAHGVEPGNRVALHMMNRPEMVVAYYACFKLGAIAAPLRTALTLTGYFEGDNYIQHNPQIGPMSQAQR
jgi:acyl-CoA synthetase (AMP-forming)/AMP-acid ligase II